MQSRDLIDARACVYRDLDVRSRHTKSARKIASCVLIDIYAFFVVENVCTSLAHCFIVVSFNTCSIHLESKPTSEQFAKVISKRSPSEGLKKTWGFFARYGVCMQTFKTHVSTAPGYTVSPPLGVPDGGCTFYLFLRVWGWYRFAHGPGIPLRRSCCTWSIPTTRCSHHQRPWCPPLYMKMKIFQ